MADKQMHSSPRLPSIRPLAFSPSHQSSQFSSTAFQPAATPSMPSQSHMQFLNQHQLHHHHHHHLPQHQHQQAAAPVEMATAAATTSTSPSAPAPATTPQQSRPAVSDIHKLMSPPDPPLDSFAPKAAPIATMMNPVASTTTTMTMSTTTTAAAAAATEPERQPTIPSPPISPYNANKTSASTELPATPPGGAQLKDPILYPQQQDGSGGQQPPLFGSPVSNERRSIVESHVAARDPSLFSNGVSPPRADEYELALYFKSSVMSHYQRDPRAWLRKNLEQLKRDNRAGAKPQSSSSSSSSSSARRRAKEPTAVKAGRPHRPDRVSKPSHNAGPRTIRAAGPAQQRQQQQQQHHPHQHQHQHQLQRQHQPAMHVLYAAMRRGGASPTPEPRRATQPNREDKDFKALPDYCPPLESLPQKPGCLKVEWKGQQVDLSKDPNAHLLHREEMMLASILRLDCATYLTSKRRLFMRRLECLRTKKEFRKTDAQQACKIDVNKASKLWSAYEKVGWLRADWVDQYL